MRILLINPNKFKKFLLNRFSLPCLGLGYLAAQAEKQGHRVLILDMDVEPTTPSGLATSIQQFRPDLIGLKSSLFTTSVTVAVASFIKQLKDIPIVVGGGGITCYPKEIMDNQCFDYGLIGEADYTFLDFIRYISHESEKKPQGLVHRQSQEIIINGPEPMVSNLDSLPIPARHLFKGKHFHIMNRTRPCASMITARGCPYHCNFCGNAGSHRSRSVPNILEEIRQIVGQGYKELYICDDTFTANKQRTLDLCAQLEKEKINLDWSIFSRVDTIDKEVLEALKATGCYHISFGLESGSDDMLDIMNKGITKSMIREKMALAKKYKFETLATFVVGYPGETQETVQETIELLRELPADLCVFSFYCLLPGSPTFKELPEQAEMKVQWLDFIKLKRTEIPTHHDQVSQRLAEEYYQLANRAFYLRPKVVVNFIKLMFASPTRFRLYLKMGTFMILMALLQRKEMQQVRKTLAKIIK